MSAPALPQTEIIRLWNSIAEDSGTLEQTLLKFAGLMLAAAHDALRTNSSDSCKAGAGR